MGPLRVIPHVRIGDLFVLGIHDRLDIGIGDQNILAVLDAMKEMNYPAASRGVSSSVLARHSVLDTESSRAFLDTGFRRYDEFAASRGECTQRDSA